jgi:NDP-sugar pyrophosphorylase family protein
MNKKKEKPIKFDKKEDEFKYLINQIADLNPKLFMKFIESWYGLGNLWDMFKANADLLFEEEDSECLKLLKESIEEVTECKHKHIDKGIASICSQCDEIQDFVVTE